MPLNSTNRCSNERLKKHTLTWIGSAGVTVLSEDCQDPLTFAIIKMDACCSLYLDFSVRESQPPVSRLSELQNT